MTDEPSNHSAPDLIDDPVRLAAGRLRPAIAELLELAHRSTGSHERQRALVRASLLMSRRQDPATHRRWT